MNIIKNLQPGKAWRTAIYYTSIALFMMFVLSGCQQHIGGVLNPKGPIAREERQLIFDSVALMMIVVLPVIIMSIAFAVRYRSSHPTSEYRPNWSHNIFLEAIWWGIPLIIIIALGILTWQKTHKLDPYRKLDMPGKPLLVEAVALRWKWLFIYPEQGIATVNDLHLPTNRPLEFWITADAPMSAFFIPQLGSQIYAMAGMRTRLHLYTSQPGKYTGLDSQYNGAGFSEMHFPVEVTSENQFDKWVEGIKTTSPNALTIPVYQQIVKPSIAAPATYYSAVRPNFFQRIMLQYTKENMRMH